ncbi:MAG: FAD-dependent oxidoreductase [Pseudomonadota bacterium]
MVGLNAPIRSIAIIGAGIIGLACARALAARGVRITVYEKSWPPRGASWAAAGMLAPAFEAVAVAESHPELFNLCDQSARTWPNWAKKLESETGTTSGYRPGPSLALAFTSKQVDHLRSVADALADHAQPPQLVTSDLNQIDPCVSDQALAGLLLPTDGQADNRATMQALLTSVQAQPLIEIKVGEAPLKSVGARLDHAGHDATLITSGWQSGRVQVEQAGRCVPLNALDPVLSEVEPIGGQMLAVAQVSGGPRLTLRSGHVYIVPKEDRIVIGATSEPGQVLLNSKPQQISRLREAAIEIAPVLATAPELDSWAGTRPGLKNYAPIIGPTEIDNVFVASGHYRNGILLAPITAEIMADMIVHRRVSELAAAFAPRSSQSEQV